MTSTTSISAAQVIIVISALTLGRWWQRCLATASDSGLLGRRLGVVPGALVFIAVLVMLLAWAHSIGAEFLSRPIVFGSLVLAAICIELILLGAAIAPILVWRSQNRISLSKAVVQIQRLLVLPMIAILVACAVIAL